MYDSPLPRSCQQPAEWGLFADCSHGTGYSLTAVLGLDLTLQHLRSIGHWPDPLPKQGHRPSLAGARPSSNIQAHVSHYRSHYLFQLRPQIFCSASPLSELALPIQLFPFRHTAGEMYQHWYAFGVSPGGSACAVRLDVCRTFSRA